VEIWLPYDDTECPVDLPDPIDLRISPRIHPSRGSRNTVIQKITNFLSEIHEPVICIDPTLTREEKKVIKSALNETGIEYKENSENYNTVVSIIRQDPLLSYRGSVTAHYLNVEWNTIKEVILSANNVKTEVEKLVDRAVKVFPNDIYTIDFIFSGDSPIDVECGLGVKAWLRGIEKYKEKWDMKVGISPLTIGSVGGYPYDANIINILISFIKVFWIYGNEIEYLLMIGDASRDLSIDPTKIARIKKEDVSTYADLIIYLFKNLASDFPFTHYLLSGYPKSLLKYLGLKVISDLNSVIKRIPSRKKRMVTVIEDVLNVNMK